MRRKGPASFRRPIGNACGYAARPAKRAGLGAFSLAWNAELRDASVVAFWISWN